MTGRHFGPRTLANHLRELADALDTVSDTNMPAPTFMRLTVHIDSPANAIVAQAERIATVDAIAAALGQSEYMGYEPAIKAYRNNVEGRTLRPGTSLELCVHAVDDPDVSALIADAAQVTR